MKRIAAAARAFLIAASLMAGTPGVAVADQARHSYVSPRTGDGHPDLQGVWTSATLTRLERPDEFGDRRVLTKDEADRVEKAESKFVADAAQPTDLDKQFTRSCVGLPFGCGYNNFWIDRGSQVITYDGEKRSSIIVQPGNGKIPPLTAQRRKALAGRAANGSFDGPEARPLGERCLLAFGSSSGPPMLPVLYNNHYQIVQTRDTVTILVEMVHDARIVRMATTHVPPSVRKWMGDSIGHWEGDTLVVETTNFTDQESFRGSTRNLKVTERFSRVAPDTINYRFTIEDPSAFTQAWSGEVPLHATDDHIYEYACHEGNYAMVGVLAGAREAEKSQTGPATAATPAAGEE